MYARSSCQITPYAAFVACLCIGGGAAAQPLAKPVAASVPVLSADQLPELGEDAPPPPVRLTTARMDLDTPVSRLCANPRAKAVLDTDLPGLTTRPEFPFFKGMSLNKLKKMSRGQMTDADLAKVQAELARLDEASAPPVIVATP